MRKKIFAIVLSIAVVMAYIPAAAITAFAGENDGNSINVATANVALATTVDDIQSAIDRGEEYIKISQSIQVGKPVYVTSSTTIFAGENASITRAPGYVGDIFVVGEDASGKDVIGDLGKSAVLFHLGLSDATDSILTIDGNNTAANGTAIYVTNSSTVNLYQNVVVQNCYKTGNERITTEMLSKGIKIGGAAAIIASGAMNLRGATLVNNKVNSNTMDGPSSLGGAIYNYGTFKMYSGLIQGTHEASSTEGNAYYGGAIYNYRTVKLFNGTLNKNSAIYGGAIAQADSQYAQTVIGNNNLAASVNISYNTAQTGGGFYSTSSNKNSPVSLNALTIYGDANAKFEGNTTKNNGAAIYTYGTVNIDGTQFNSNSGREGGAVYVYGDVNINDSTFNSNSSSGNGGALYLDTAEAKMNEVTFNSNSSSGNGGALYLHTAEAKMNEVTFTNNYGDRAGAIYCTKSNLKIYGLNKNSLFKDNKSANHAGAISFHSCSNAEIYKTTFDGNITGWNNSTSTIDAAKNGGALWAYQTSGGTVRVQDCEFKNNSATLGSAINVSNGSVLNLYNNKVKPNSEGKPNNEYNNEAFLYETVSTSVTDTNVTIIGLTATGFQNEPKKLIHINNPSLTLNINWSTCTCDGNLLTKDTCLSSRSTLDPNPIRDITDSAPSYIDYDGTIVGGTSGSLVSTPSTDVDEIFALAEGTDRGMDETYNPGLQLNNDSNFQSRGTKTYSYDGKNVTADTFVYQPGTPDNNPNVGEGIMIYQAMKYKQAHPTKDVDIDITSWHFSPEAAVNLNRTSPYFGYMRSLKSAEYDQYGFVRLSYLLVSAAKMGIKVNVMGQTMAATDSVAFQDYFAGHMNDQCDAKYASAKTVKDYLDCTKIAWDCELKSSADLMHTKACAVSHYTDMDGNDHGGTVWLSSSNLDNILPNGCNGHDALQTGIIISDHDGIYRVTKNYFNLAKKYSYKAGVYLFRNAINRLSTEQIDKLEAGGIVPQDEQVVYMDDVFELYFSAIGGDNAKWDEVYNPMDKYIRALANSDDYIWFGMNNPKYGTFSLGDTTQKLIAKAFNTNKNSQNRIDVNIDTLGNALDLSYFDPAPYAALTLGTDIGVKKVDSNDYSPIHSKDMLISYSKNGVRSYVTLISSMNMHEGSASYQSNFALVVKENNCDENSVFRAVAENSMNGFIGSVISNENISLDKTGYLYTGQAVKPQIIVKDGTGNVISDSYYDVSFENNLNIGEAAKVIVKGKNGYAGTAIKNFTIVPEDVATINDSDVSVDTLQYTGKGLCPIPRISFNGKQLVNGTDFTLSYSNNIEIGSLAKVTISGKGNFTGSKTVNFTITQADLENAQISPIKAYTYDGKAKQPKLTVSQNDNLLVEGVDYQIEYLNNVNAGTGAIAIITGMGNYNGENAAAFEIKKASIGKVTISTLTYNGYSGRTPVVYFWGKKLSTSAYSLTFYSDSRAKKYISKTKVKNVGTYYVKITSKSVNFSGYVIKKLVIYPKAIALKSVAAGKKMFTARWTATATQTTGYQIKYSTKKTMTSAKVKTVTKYKTAKLTVKSLKARTTYYVQIRKYKTVGTTKYYSTWSKVKAVRTLR